MHPSICRYSKVQFKSLGLTDRFNDCVVSPIDKTEHEKQLSFVKGKFANVIDLLFDSCDGSLDNCVSKYVGENAPECVRSFVNNILLSPVQALPPAGSDDVALEMIIPRSVQTSAEMQPYLDNFRQIVSDAQAAAASKFNANGSTGAV